MKKIFTFILCASVFITNAFTQDTLSLKIKEPDFPFEPMYLDSNYSLVDLPLEKYDITTKSGVGKANIFYLIKTPKSTFSLSATKTLTLVVKQGLVNGSMTNVKDIYKLFKVTVNEKKKTRSCLITSAKWTTQSFPDDLPITYRKVRDDIYLLIIKNPEPGEYIIEVKVREAKLYSFSIN